MAGQPKAPFYFAVFAVVAGLVAFAAYRATRPANNAGGGNHEPQPQITMPAAPRWAKVPAMAAPRPWVPPVTMATLPPSDAKAWGVVEVIVVIVVSVRGFAIGR